MEAEFGGEPEAGDGFDSVDGDGRHEESDCDRGGEAFAGLIVAPSHEPYSTRREPPAGAMENGACLKGERVRYRRGDFKCGDCGGDEPRNWVTRKDRSCNELCVHANRLECVATDSKMSDASAGDLVVAGDGDFENGSARPACACENFGFECVASSAGFQSLDDGKRV